MLSGFDEPDRVWLHRLLVTRYLLLFKGPVRQLDFVREQITPCHRMPQSEVRPEGSQALRRLAVTLVALVDLHNPVVVRITRVVRHAIARYLLLEVDIRDRRTLVMRVQVLVRRDVLQLDLHARLDVREGLGLPVMVWVAITGRIQDSPVVVVVTVWVEGDLLFCQCL